MGKAKAHINIVVIGHIDWVKSNNHWSPWSPGINSANHRKIFGAEKGKLFWVWCAPVLDKNSKALLTVSLILMCLPDLMFRHRDFIINMNPAPFLNFPTLIVAADIGEYSSYSKNVADWWSCSSLCHWRQPNHLLVFYKWIHDHPWRSRKRKLQKTISTILAKLVGQHHGKHLVQFLVLFEVQHVKSHVNMHCLRDESPIAWQCHGTIRLDTLTTVSYHQLTIHKPWCLPPRMSAKLMSWALC